MLYNKIMYFCWSNEVSSDICFVNRIASAIRKHIVPQEALAGAGVAVGVEESSEGWVVISALEVVEARLFDDGLPLEANWDDF